MEIIELKEGLELETNNDKKAVFSYMSDFDNPIFILDDKYKVTIVDNVMHSANNDYDEPCTPLKQEYQLKILETHKYDFFKSHFIKRG